MLDAYGVELKDGDIIDINQTVNGQNVFVVLTVSPLDIRYKFNLDYKYEYDSFELLTIGLPFTDEVDWVIIGNINDRI